MSLISLLADATGVVAGTDQEDDTTRRLDMMGIRREVLVFELEGTINGATSLDVVVQDSWDDGANWNDLATFTQLTASGREVQEPTRRAGPLLRVKRTSVGDGWDYKVRTPIEHF